MKTLYEKHKARFDELFDGGYPAIAEMAKHFADHNDMSSALGYTHGTVRHWVNGANNISQKSHRLAKAWLDQNKSTETQRSATPAPVSGDGLYLVTCPAGTQEKARKLLTFIGCEMIEV